MLLKSLSLTNFLSHESTKIDFAADRKLLIDGQSGAGKTSIVEAIIWCLYGKARLENRSLIKLGKTTAKVELVLTNNDDVFSIRRSITKKGTQTLDISLEDGTGKARAVGATSLKEKQAYIEKEILKSGYDLFVNSVAYPQNSQNSFVNQTASRRKELLLEIVGAGNFEEYLEKAKEISVKLDVDAQVMANEIKNTDLLIVSIKEEIAQFEKNSFDVDLQKKNIALQDILIADSVEAIGTLKKTIEELITKSAAAMAAIVERTNLTKELATLVLPDLKPLTTELQTLEWSFPELAKEREEYTRLLNAKEMVRAIEARKKELEVMLAGLPTALHDERIKSTNKKLIELLSSQTDLCPNTNKVCVKAQAMVEARQIELETELNQATTGFNMAKAKETEISNELASLVVPSVDDERIASLKIHLEEEARMVARKAEITNAIAMAGIVNDRRSAVSRRLTELPEALGDTDEVEIDKKKKELDAAENLLSDLKATKSRLEFDLSAWITAAEVIKKKKEYETDLEAKKDEFNKSAGKFITDAENVKMIKDALGPNGIKVVIVDTVLPRLELRVNEILSELSEFKIKFDTQRASASDEDKKIEGLFITIINDQGEELDFEGYSGGERLKIIVAISEALAELQKTKFRLIDELFLGLDEDSVGRFGEILMKLQERFSQVLCISHLPTIKGLFEDKITVTKKNGTSSVS